MIKIYILSNDIGFVRSFDALFDKGNFKVESLSIKPEEVFNYICKHETDFLLIHSIYLKNNYQIGNILVGNK